MVNKNWYDRKKNEILTSPYFNKYFYEIYFVGLIIITIVCFKINDGYSVIGAYIIAGASFYVTNRVFNKQKELTLYKEKLIAHQKLATHFQECLNILYTSGNRFEELTKIEINLLKILNEHSLVITKETKGVMLDTNFTVLTFITIFESEPANKKIPKNSPITDEKSRKIFGSAERLLIDTINYLNANYHIQSIEQEKEKVNIVTPD